MAGVTRGAANGTVMGWVVKQWRPEGVAALIGEQAREVRAAAEREARRWQRMARRERAVADDELQRLEVMGEELLQRVRLHRAGLRAPVAPPDAGRPEITVTDLRRRPRASARSRLRDSPLAGLFAASQRRTTMSR